MMPKIYYRILQTDGVVKKLKYYDGLVIEAPILEQYTNFAVSLVSTIDEPFFIDPTHKFVLRDLKRIAEKEWSIKVMEAYEISECLQEGEISFELLREKLDSFVRAVIRYQKERLGKSSGGLELFGVVPRLKPQIILTPYFLIDGIDSESYKLNIEMIENSITQKGEEELYAVIALERYLISRDLSKLISDFAMDGVDGFCIWVSDFREYEEDVRMLEKYVEFFRQLSETGKPVINLYGGTFSIFIGKLGFIAGVVQGIGYGEYRDPFVHATGGYPKRYYIPKLHRSVPIYLAQELLATIPDLKCNCEFCSVDLREKEVRTDSLKGHYMLNRWREKETKFDELYEDLQETIKLLNKSGVMDKYWYQLRHLVNWSKVLEKI